MEKELNRLVEASKLTMDLWIKYGLGEDENESHPIFILLNKAILDAEIVLAVKASQNRQEAMST